MTPDFRALWKDASAEAMLRTLICAAVVWCALWIAVPILFAVLAPSDNIEQMVWSQGWELGYHKHPPLPTWLLIGASRVLPLSNELTYALAVLGMFVGGYFLWRLSEALLGRLGAVLVVLATASIGFYSYRAHIYNHNTVLVPFVYAAAWYYYRAFNEGRLRDWLLLGAICAGGILTKYQFLLLPTVFLLVAGWLGRLRDMRFIGHSLLAMAVTAVLLIPHVRWLIASDFLPFQYVDESVMVQFGIQERTTRALGFLAQQLRFVLPALAMLWFAVLIARRSQVPALAAVERAEKDANRVWVMALGLGPLALMLILMLLFGLRLKAHFGTTAVQFIALPVVFWVCRRRIAVDARAALIAFLIVQTVTAAYFIGREVFHGRAQLENGRVRAFDPAALGRDVDRDWRSVTQEPLRYVVGTTTIGAFVALNASQRPQLLLDGRSQESPWVNMAKLERCGAVYLAPLEPPPGRAVALRGSYTSISYERRKSGRKETISWAIVAPDASCPNDSNTSVVGGQR